MPLSYLKCTEHADFALTPRHLLRRRGVVQAAPPASDSIGAGNPIGLSAEMPPPLEVGDGVVLGGLVKRSELNDLLGTLMGWHEGRGRWTVKLMSVSKPVLLKPANLRRLTASIGAAAGRRPTTPPSSATGAPLPPLPFFCAGEPATLLDSDGTHSESVVVAKDVPRHSTEAHVSCSVSRTVMLPLVLHVRRLMYSRSPA